MGSDTGFRPVFGICAAVAFFLFLVWISYANAESDPSCGTIDEVLANHDFRAKVPWTAALYFQSTQCDFRPAGNGHGVILGPTTVLIKGNFIWSNDGYGGIHMESYSPNHFMVVVGLKSKLPFLADQHTQFLKVANIQPHYQSYDAFSEYDYAIVHLKNPIQFTSFVRPLCLNILPEGIFDRSNNSFLNEHLAITGFRIGSGSTKSVLHTDKEPFGLLSPEFCTSKLEWDLGKAPASLQLTKVQTPCGISVKGFDEMIDVRSFGGGGVSKNDISYTYLKKMLNFTYLEAVKGHRPISNVCFHNGAAVTTMYQGRWHLVGLVTESLGMSCDKNLYFVSFVASKNNLNWIFQHLRHGPSSFICNSGQTIPLESSVCNGEEDCLDGSDEDSKLCACAPMCGNSPCSFQPKCKHCDPSDSLKILNQQHNFSVAVNPSKSCNPVYAPKGATVYCKAPGFKSHIPCNHEHFYGTQAVFSCQNFDITTPATYCVITCQQNGQWTDELSTFNCKPPSQEEETVPIAERRNFTNINTSPSPTSTGGTKDISVKPTPTTVKAIVDEKPISFVTSQYKDKNGTLLCPPIETSVGTEIFCWGKFTHKTINCSEPMNPGSKAEFTCSRYYKPLLSTASVTKYCQEDGQWSLGSRNFECRVDCGVPKSDYIGHVTNGRETDGAKWPWHGLIFIDIGGHNFTYICGSTLVSKRILITAAHCMVDRQGNPRNATLFKVLMAAMSNIYHKNILDEEIQIFDITKIVVNSLFNPANFEADIAIIQLSRPVDVSDYVRPACYPTSLAAHTEVKHLSPGSIGEVVGFGYDETGQPSKTLREASLPVVSYKDCYEVSKIQHSSTQYCAGYTNGTAVCNGDSGSGMFFMEDAPQPRMYLQGLVSHGNRDANSRLCDHNQYSVFTKVASFKTWISDVGYELDDEF
ncbi:unnamed protein product [Orchesella dallaii]|uniref:Limulus clotting factor C n=1 Tax=Orchesella dallaii TaxID=48710 RepID=A0ABP1QQ71_9HEXA